MGNKTQDKDETEEDSEMNSQQFAKALFGTASRTLSIQIDIEIERK